MALLLHWSTVPPVRWSDARQSTDLRGADSAANWRPPLLRDSAGELFCQPSDRPLCDSTGRLSRQSAGPLLRCYSAGRLSR
eukprot:2595144-Pyramimonas_sp.AAC.1